MNTKQKLAYIVLGGVLVAAGMIISPLNAQKDKFGEIECESLKVNGQIQCRDLWVDAKESIVKEFGYVYGTIMLKTPGGNTTYITPSNVQMWDSEDNIMVNIGINKHGGYVGTKGRSKGHAIMRINQYGNGVVSTYDKNGYLR